MSEFNLENHPKLKPGFRTPDGYFESFADRLSERLPVTPGPRIVPFYRRRPVWIGTAAVFVLLMGLALYFKAFTPQEATAQSDAEAIENYLVYQQGINSYDLMQNLDVQDIKEIEASLDNISDDAIEEYLSTEDVYLTE